MRDSIFLKVNELPGLRVWVSALFIFAYLASYVVLGATEDTDTNTILNTNPYLLLALQAFSSALFFLVIPWLMVRFFWKVEDGVFPLVDMPSTGWVFLIVFSNLFVLSGIIEWNTGLDLPDGPFEDWAVAKEAELKALTEHLIEFQGFGHLMLALFAVALLPALGEEILFRGILQNATRKLFRNKHLAIWFCAFLFSAVHLQFYGFFPRMLLGALFGYLYVWSGNLSVAVLAHFFHNGLALVGAYVASSSSIPVEPDQLEKSAPVWLIGTFAIIVGFSIFKFHQLYHLNDKMEERL